MTLIAVSCNAITAACYLGITCHLVRLSRSLHLQGSPAGVKTDKLVAFSILTALLVALCGLTHILNVIREYYPHIMSVQAVQTVVLVSCAVMSLAVFCDAFHVFPEHLKVLRSSAFATEGNLNESEDNTWDIANMVNESVILLSTDLKIVRKNEASKELFGSPNLVGKSVREFIHPDDLRRFEIFVEAAQANYTAVPTTIEYRLKPASHIHVTARGAPVKTHTCSKKGKVHCNTDPPTERVYNSSPFTHTSSTASLVHSAKGNRTEYIWVESTMLKHMQMDNDEVLHTSLEMVTRNIEDRRKKQSNTYDSIVKETEEQTRVNAAKMRYLSCIAHDLKTPLQSFCYTLDLLLQTKLRSEQRELIQQANVAVDLMKLTISQTMDISKALTGAQLQPRRATVCLSSVIKRVEMLIFGYGKQVPVTFARAPNIIDTIITDEEWLWQMLLNLLTNACKYTDKGSITVRISLADPPSQELSEDTQAVEVFTPPEVVLFEVIDTGVGVHDETLVTMFDAFSQVQEGQVTGTGLGLYGVRMRAEGLQGTCGARHNTESSTGTGTVMWFSIPYLPDRSRTNSSEQEDEDSDSPREQSNNNSSASLSSAIQSMSSPPPAHSELSQRAMQTLRSRPLTAMVVEDTLTVRKLMERMLLQMGFTKVVGYENGSKGLDAMMAEPVDIVFSDVQMPIMTGPEMINRFRKFEELAIASGERSKRQIVVAVTANGSEMHDNVNSGFDDVYPKPLGRNDIYKIINQFM